jgi:hypothetical protein
LARFQIPPDLGQIIAEGMAITNAAVEAFEKRYPDCHINN